MDKITYNDKQLSILKKNRYIKNCSPKYITFTDEFKIEALWLDSNWVYFRDIFKHFWFPDFIIDSEVPRHLIKSWRYKMKTLWVDWLISTRKWRKKKELLDIDKMSKDEYIEYLETKLAYMEELKKMIDKWHYP